MMFRLTAAIAAIALLVVAPVSASSGAALGAEGEIYMVRAGSYGELFPDEGDRPPETPVLALDILRKGEPLERQLVPGTEGDQQESTPSLSLHKASNTVYLVWEATSSPTPYSLLFVASLSPDGWSDVIEYSGNPFSFKSRPRLAVTRHQALTLDPDGPPASRERTILHLVWWDEGGVGDRALYTPLVFEEGQLIGFNPIFSLDDFIPDGTEPVTPIPRASLYRAPRIEPGRDGESVVVAFTSLAANRILGLEIRVLPDDLVALAERGRAQVILVGARSGISRVELATEVQTAMAADGSQLFEGPFADYVALQLGTFLRESPEPDLPTLAEYGRAQVILVGVTVRMRSNGLDDPTRTRLVEFGGVGGDEQVFLFRVASMRHTPITPDRAVTTFLSDDGASVLLAWDVDAGVRYIESDGAGWSQRRTLDTGDDLSVAEAYRVLRDRVRP